MSFRKLWWLSWMDELSLTPVWTTPYHFWNQGFSTLSYPSEMNGLFSTHTGFLSRALDKFPTDVHSNAMFLVILLQAVLWALSSGKRLSGHVLFSLLFYIFSPFICSMIWLEVKKPLWDLVMSRLNLGAGALLSTVIAQGLGNEFPGEGEKLCMDTCSHPAF